MKLKQVIFFVALSLFVNHAFGQLQDTWVKTLYYYSSAAANHYDSLHTGPSGYAGRNDGKFFVLNMDYEQGIQNVYLVDSMANILSSTPAGYWGNLQERDSYGLKKTADSGCVFIQHFFDFGGGPPQLITYSLMHLNKYSVLSTLHTWTYPDVVTEVIPNYHNSYYCKLNGNFLDIATGITYPSGSVGMGPFINDEFIFSDSTISRKDINGNVSWSVPSDGFTPVSFSETSVYITKDSLRKLDASDGHTLWTNVLPDTGKYYPLLKGDGILIQNGYMIYMIDSAGNLVDQNELDLTLDPPLTLQALNDGSIIGGGQFKSFRYGNYKRSPLIYRLDERGHGIIDSTSFFFGGDADQDTIIQFFDDAVMIARALHATHPKPDINCIHGLGYRIYREDWAQSFGTGLNYKFSDVNCDAVIDTNDLNLLSNPVSFNDTYTIHHKDSTGIPLYVRVANPIANPGDTIVWYLIFGRAGQVIDSVYGISFTTGFSCGPQFDFMDIQLKNGIFGDTATDLFMYSTSALFEFSKGAVECRTDLQNINISGGDTLATFRGVLNPLSIANLCIGNVSAHIINEGGFTIPFWSIGDTLNILVNKVLEVSGSNAIKLYPNPSKSFLYVSSEKEIDDVQVTDICGQMIFSQQIHSKEFEVSIEKLTAGIYFLRYLTKQGSEQVKFVVGQ